LVVTASHCHGVPAADVADRAFKVIEAALANLTPVTLATAQGSEDRVSENRRFQLNDGTQADARRAYSLPDDNELIDIGPIDPSIGVLRVDRVADGVALA